jgi:hypothetical protein
MGEQEPSIPQYLHASQCGRITCVEVFTVGMEFGRKKTKIQYCGTSNNGSDKKVPKYLVFIGRIAVDLRAGPPAQDWVPKAVPTLHRSIGIEDYRERDAGVAARGNGHGPDKGAIHQPNVVI